MGKKAYMGPMQDPNGINAQILPIWVPYIHVCWDVAHCTCRVVQIVHFFFNRKMNKCIRMGKTAFKFVIWGGKSAVLRSQITFYGSADASP